MKRLLQILALCAAAHAAEPLQIPGWQLVWHDEFDGPKIDASKWSPCERGKSDWCDTMSKDPRCFSITDGILRLHGFKNDKPEQDPSPYLTGGLTS